MRGDAVQQDAQQVAPGLAAGCAPQVTRDLLCAPKRLEPLQVQSQPLLATAVSGPRRLCRGRCFEGQCVLGHTVLVWDTSSAAVPSMQRVRRSSPTAGVHRVQQVDGEPRQWCVKLSTPARSQDSCAHKPSETGRVDIRCLLPVH